MSEMELFEASSPWWSPFAALLLIGLFVLACWVVVHPAPTWTFVRLVWRRGRDYRRQLRRARHRRNTLTHLSFRSTR